MSIERLIGIDYYHSFFLTEVIRSNENEPIAVNYHFGWIVSGSFKHFRFPSADGTNIFFVKNEPFHEQNDLNNYFSQVFRNDRSEPESKKNVL